jgi:hypothetical protein
MSTGFFSFLGFFVGARVVADFLEGVFAAVGVGDIAIGAFSLPSS